MRGLVDHGAWVWPVVLREGDVELRPLRRSDAQVWRAVRSANVSWLTPWEATHPDAEAIPPPTFGQMVRSFNREARSGRMPRSPSPTAGNCRPAHGPASPGVRCGPRTPATGSTAGCRQGSDSDRARAHCRSLLLHRRAAPHRDQHRPENGASLRVAHKLGFRPEGLRPRFLTSTERGGTMRPSRSRSRSSGRIVDPMAADPG